MKPAAEFGLVLATGLLATGAALAAGTSLWVEVPGASDLAAPAAAVLGEAADPADGSSLAPAAAPLAVVSLAAWGAVLVARRRTRRWVAALGVLAGVGGAVAVLLGWSGAVSDVERALSERAALTPGHSGTTASGTAVTDSLQLTLWPGVAMVSFLAVALSWVLVLLRSGGYPVMSAKYDAPAMPAPAPDGSPQAPQGAGHQNVDWWRALDHGQDPTL